MDGGTETLWTRRRIAAAVAPPLLIALAGIAARTPLAAAFPATAALLFLWVAADTIMLALVARTAPARPAPSAVIAALATASLTVWIAAPAPLRAALWAMPPVLVAMACALLGHVALAALAGRRAWRADHGSRPARWRALAETIVPPMLLRLALAELSVLHIALFRWGGPADVPDGARAFSYHRHLTPMCAALLILSVIEAGVYHLLLSHWSGSAALIMFVLSDVGLVYVIGLIKSFRFRPVLVTAEGVRVRAGFLIDRLIPFDAIAGIDTAFEGTTVKAPTTLNAALLAWPNVLIRLHGAPLSHRWRPGRRYTAVAIRLDEPEPFLALVAWRVGLARTGA